jgi:hypothetical protein
VVNPSSVYKYTIYGVDKDLGKLAPLDESLPIFEEIVEQISILKK